MPYVRKSGYRRRPRAKRPMVRRTRRVAVRKAPMYRRPTSGFPQMKIVSLKYCSQHMLPSVPLSVTGSHQFRTNSIYDPDYTSSGHQPYGFDQWSAVYGRYEVLASTCTVRFVTSQGFQNALCSVIVTNDLDSSTDLTLVRERPGASYRLVTSQKPVTIKKTWKFRKDAPNHAGWDNTALMTTDPGDSDYFRVFVSNVDGSTALSQYSVACLVEIRYLVKLWDRENLTTS